jgi:hypothetical protein
LRLADGWDPFGFTADDLSALLERAQRWPEGRERHAPFDFVFAPEQLIVAATTAAVDAITTLIVRYGTLGATHLNLRFRHRSLAEYLDQIAAFMSRVTPQFA